MLQTLISFVKSRAEDPLAVIGAALVIVTVAVAAFVSADLRKKTNQPEDRKE